MAARSQVREEGDREATKGWSGHRWAAVPPPADHTGGNMTEGGTDGGGRPRDGDQTRAGTNGRGTLATREYRGETAPGVPADEQPDVLLDVPVVKVDEIELDVDDLRARVSLQSEVLDLLKLNVGADVVLGRVHLGIKGVDAQALLKVRLDNVARIIERVLTTVDENPQILEHVTRGAGEAVQEVGGGAREALGDLGQIAGKAVRGVGTAVRGVGRKGGADKAVGDRGPDGRGSAAEGRPNGSGPRIGPDTGTGNRTDARSDARTETGNRDEEGGEPDGSEGSIGESAARLASALARASLRTGRQWLERLTGPAEALGRRSGET